MKVINIKFFWKEWKSYTVWFPRIAFFRENNLFC